MGHRDYTSTEVESVGANHWAQVWHAYSEWAKIYGYSTRDQAMVKQKFDRLANENRPTGDAHCPPNVRRTKRIARAILGHAQSIALGGTGESDWRKQ